LADVKIDPPIGQGPRLWPIALALSVLVWIIVTTGGRQLFVKEALGDAFDSQAEHFLHGNVDVDGQAIRWEAMIVNGKARMYFGPFPALLRIPLDLLYPDGRGRWSRISGFLAAELGLFSFAGLISGALSTSLLSSRARNWFGGTCLVGLVFATPLLFLVGNLSIYNEAIIWAFAWSIAAIFFAWQSGAAEGRTLTLMLLGFSISAACALLSRVTYGAALVLIAPLLAIQLIRQNRLRYILPLSLPLAIGFAFYFLLSYARFGTFTGISFDHYINPVHREFAHRYGIFSLERIPYSLADYFGFRFPVTQAQAPFLRADRHSFSHPQLYSLPFSETYLPIPWVASWLLFGAVAGAVFLFQKRRSDFFERGAAVAFMIQALMIMSYYTLSQRYSVDLYPLLIFCFVLFLLHGGRWLVRSYAIIIGLVMVSVAVNSLTTVSWLVEVDQNVQPETRSAWQQLLGRQ
jgi:hypothetical protein